MVCRCCGREVCGVWGLCQFCVCHVDGHPVGTSKCYLLAWFRRTIHSPRRNALDDALRERQRHRRHLGVVPSSAPKTFCAVAARRRVGVVVECERECENIFLFYCVHRRARALLTEVVVRCARRGRGRPREAPQHPAPAASKRTHHGGGGGGGGAAVAGDDDGDTSPNLAGENRDGEDDLSVDDDARDDDALGALLATVTDAGTPFALSALAALSPDVVYRQAWHFSRRYSAVSQTNRVSCFTQKFSCYQV